MYAVESWLLRGLVGLGDFNSYRCFSSPTRAHLRRNKQSVVSNTARFILLSDEETESIVKVAKECAEGECSLDEVTALVSDLKEQQELLELRLNKITTMIGDLEHLNAKDERKDAEVRQLVKDMLRVFAHEVRGIWRITNPPNNMQDEVK